MCVLAQCCVFMEWCAVLCSMRPDERVAFSSIRRAPEATPLPASLVGLEVEVRTASYAPLYLISVIEL